MSFDTAYKGVCIRISKSKTAKSLLSGRFRKAKERFIAGDTLGDGIARVRALNNTPVNGRTVNMGAILDYVGEGVTDLQGARHARDTYLQILDAIHKEGLNATVAIKLTQLGLLAGPDDCAETVVPIFERSRDYGISPQIDAEEARYAEGTMRVYDGLRRRGFGNVVITLQAYRRAAEREARQLRERGAAVRLVKGAYKEPPGVAYQRKREVDASYRRLLRIMMDGARIDRNKLTVATHDERIIREVVNDVAYRNPLDRNVEIAVLLGVKNEMLGQLAYRGRRTSVYVPYGPDWFPYFCRRLGERPANLFFVARNLFSR